MKYTRITPPADRRPVPRRTHMDCIEERFPIHDHNENAHLCTGQDFCAENPERTVPFDRLPDTEIDGFPLYISRDGSGALQATFSANTHALIIGSTGSGKTTGFVLPFLNWMPTKKNKPGIIVSDPKNELNELTVNRFLENGYRVIWLNFQDYTVSDCWNPLSKIYRRYQDYLAVAESVGVTTEKGKRCNTFEGRVYKRQKELDAAIAERQEYILAEVSNMIGSIAESISPVQKQDDPYWDQISSTFIRGFLWAMLEDSVPEKGEGRITEETYSFDTLIKIYDTFKDESGEGIIDYGYFTSRDPATSRAYQLVVASIIELRANITRGCIKSCFAEKLKNFRDPTIRRITSANTFDIAAMDDDDRPTAIFVSYKDEDSLHYGVISLFISDLYTTLIETARRKGGVLERPFYFLLDEFGNFPKFKDFEHVISACRSRGIWFFLIVQSYAQLERVYDKKTAEIIIDNLNMHIFFGSGNFETKAAFSRECGSREVLSPLSAINGSQGFVEHYSTQLVPLVPVSRLSDLQAGECIVTQMSGNVLMSRIERSYLCPEYDNGKSRLIGRPSPVSPLDNRHSYDIGWLLNEIKRKPRSPFDF